MPLGLERAYGGVALADELPTPFADNPTGKGFYLEEEEAEGGPLPNVEAPERLIEKWDDRPEPAGVGFCPVGFGPRAQRAAVIRGDTVVQVRSAINNVAFPTLVCPNPQRGELVVLRGMGPELRFRLPSEPIVAVTRVRDAEYEDVMRIDQIGIEPARRRLFVTYRYTFVYPLRSGDVRYCQLIWKRAAGAAQSLSEAAPPAEGEPSHG